MVAIFEFGINAATDIRAFARHEVLAVSFNYLRNLVSILVRDLFQKHIAILDRDLILDAASLLVMDCSQLPLALEYNLLNFEEMATDVKHNYPEHQRDTGVPTRMHTHNKLVQHAVHKSASEKFGTVYKDPVHVVDVTGAPGEKCNENGGPACRNSNIRKLEFSKMGGKVVHAGDSNMVVVTQSDFSLRTFFNGAYAPINVSSLHNCMNIQGNLSGNNYNFDISAPDLQSAVTRVNNVVFASSVAMSTSIEQVLRTRLEQLKNVMNGKMIGIYSI